MTPVNDRLDDLSGRFDNINLEEASEEIRRATLRINPLIALRPPPMFSGALGQNLEEWFVQFEHFMTLQGITPAQDNFRLAYLEANFSGAALASFRELKSSNAPPQTYDGYKNEMLHLYPIGRDSDLYQQHIYDRKQRFKETALEYVDDLKKIAASAFPDLNSNARHAIIKPIFLRGLQPTVREAIRFREFTDLSEATKAAAYAESQLARDNIDNHNATISNAVLHLETNKIRDLEEKLSNIQKQISKSNRRYCANCKTNMHSTEQCYYRNNNNNQRTNNGSQRPNCEICGRSNHGTNQCRSPCRNCGRTGHRTSQCRMPPRSGNIQNYNNYQSRELLCTCCYCPKHGAYSKSVQTRNEKSSGNLSRESDQQTKIDEKPQTILSPNQIAVDNLTVMLNSMEMDIESIEDKSVKDALEKHATNVKQTLSNLICEKST
uniref:CCHC-type domain-containing protein n=1 Tax=Romanomermis culicivorax TaxID=13658 RepID=A0A915HYN2_ROMCU